jgi:hypothetical protein
LLGSGTCVSTQQASDWYKAARNAPNNRVGVLLKQLDEVFDPSGGAIGQQWQLGPFDLTNPGPAGASLVWTDTKFFPWQVLTAGQTVKDNVFPVLTQGEWGIYVVFTAVRVPTPGRSARLCDKVDLATHFPGHGRIN